MAWCDGNTASPTRPTEDGIRSTLEAAQIELDELTKDIAILRAAVQEEISNTSEAYQYCGSLFGLADDWMIHRSKLTNYFICTNMSPKQKLNYMVSSLDESLRGMALDNRNPSFGCAVQDAFANLDDLFIHDGVQKDEIDPWLFRAMNQKQTQSFAHFVSSILILNQEFENSTFNQENHRKILQMVFSNSLVNNCEPKYKDMFIKAKTHG